MRLASALCIAAAFALGLTACGGGGGGATKDQEAVGDAIAVVADPDLHISCLTLAQVHRLQSAPRLSLSRLGRDADTGRPLPAGRAAFMRLAAWLDDHQGLQVLSVEGRDGVCVPATVETVGDGSYPLKP